MSLEYMGLEYKYKLGHLLLEFFPEKTKIKVCIQNDCKTIQLLEFMRLIWRFVKLLEKVIPEACRRLNQKVQYYIEEFAKERVISANSLEEAIEQFEKQIIEENIKIWRLQGTAYFLENYVSNALRWLKIDLAIFIEDIIKLEDEENVNKIVEIEVEMPEKEEEILKVKVCLHNLCESMRFLEFLKLVWKFAKMLEGVAFRKFKNDIYNDVYSALHSLRIYSACLLNYIDELEDEEERRFLDENDVCKELEDDC